MLSRFDHAVGARATIFYLAFFARTLHRTSGRTDIIPACGSGRIRPIPHSNGSAPGLRWTRWRELAPPVLRWPGGCFADAYNWRDGVGPREARPRRVTSRWGRDEIETNGFGTHEFIDLCREIGAEPWLAASAGSGSPREVAQWVEYCNFPSGTTISDARAKKRRPGAVWREVLGHRQRKLGLWRQTHTAKLTPPNIARVESLFPQFSRSRPGFDRLRPRWEQSRTKPRAGRAKRLAHMEEWRRPRLDGWDAHFYTWNTDKRFGSSTDFSLDEYYGLLHESLKIGDLIDEQRAILDACEIGREAKLILGEWGIWHAAEEGHGACCNSKTPCATRFRRR